jgi:23S rRNA (uracil-5-)-methyltransferase RumA
MGKKRNKGTFEVTIQENKYPFIGFATIEGKRYRVKNVLKGQTIKARVIRKKADRAEGKLLEILERASYETESRCEHFPECGGCLMQTVSYDKQLQMIEQQVLDLFKEKELTGFNYNGIVQSPRQTHYRNKMEYTFGNAVKDGPLTLGLHPRGRFHDIINTFECLIAPKDFNIIQQFTQEYFLGKDISFYNKHSHEGYLRHLLLRKGMKTGEIIIAISTSSQQEFDYSEYIEELKKLDLSGEIVGIMHVINDRMADALIPEEVRIIHGRDYYMDEILGLKFKVSLFSFFQTNPEGAEVLYTKALSYISDMEDKVVYDLFSGTGTIGQIVSKKASRVYGIELVEEAVQAAIQNAELNNISNCTFIAGDVFEKLDHLEERPDIIILDPPRVGVSEKALAKIIDYNIDEMIYISCNPKTFADNAVQLKSAGYEIKELVLVDMFPNSSHVEAVAKLKRAL